MYRTRLLVAVIGLALIILQGCASTTPAFLKEVPKGDLRVSEVQADPQRFKGSKVRWGGSIIKVDNLKNQTMIEVLSRPLSSDGKPDSDSKIRWNIPRTPC